MKGKIYAGSAGKRMWLFLALALLLAVIGLLAPVLMPNDPMETHADFMKVAPCSRFPWGTDSLGRCVLSRVLAGTCTSVFSALGLVAVSFLMGTVLGMLCGYYGGLLDTVIMRVADVLLAFPQMVLAIAVAGILGGGMKNALLALGISSWTVYARLARSAVLRVREEDYIAAAQLSGCGAGTILLRYIFPNIIGILLVTAVTQIGSTMIGIAGLSFLGIGVIPPVAEWGSMISEARGYMQLAPWAVLGPAGAVIVTVLVFNCLGDAIRDMADVGK